MLTYVLRGAAVSVGAAVVLGGLAAPAAAEEIVPAGCVGSVFYACTGDAEVPVGHWNAVEHHEVPVEITTPTVPLVPGQTVGGQQIGGVIIPVGGVGTPEIETSVGGPVPPTDTGVVTPVQICAFVVCLPAGTPVVVPGLSLPAVPVRVPPTVIPRQDVEVPFVGTVPTHTVQPVVVPGFRQGITTLHVYENPNDAFVLGSMLCEIGGGEVQWTSDDTRWYPTCSGGVLKPAADTFFERLPY